MDSRTCTGRRCRLAPTGVRRIAPAGIELDHLTDATGGVAVHTTTLDDVEKAAVDLARRIRHQYTLAYAPVNQALDGSYRRIRVVVNAVGRYSVRTRPGYFATGRGTR